MLTRSTVLIGREKVSAEFHGGVGARNRHVTELRMEGLRFTAHTRPIEPRTWAKRSGFP